MMFRVQIPAENRHRRAGRVSFFLMSLAVVRRLFLRNRRPPMTRRRPAAPSLATAGRRVVADGMCCQYVYPPELAPLSPPVPLSAGGATAFGVPVGRQERFFLPSGATTNHVPPTPWPFHCPGFSSPA